MLYHTVEYAFERGCVEEGETPLLYSLLGLGRKCRLGRGRALPLCPLSLVSHTERWVGCAPKKVECPRSACASLTAQGGSFQEPPRPTRRDICKAPRIPPPR